MADLAPDNVDPRTAAIAKERAGGYKVTPEELDYDQTLALPGAEERARATAVAASRAAGGSAAPADSASLAPPAAPAPRVGWEVTEEEANSIAGVAAKSAPQPQVPGNTQPAPGWMDTAAAASRQFSLPGAVYERLVNSPDSNAPDVEGYSPYDNHGIAGYEDYRMNFVDAHSPQQTQVIKERIDQERRDKQTIAAAGPYKGGALVMAAGFSDPISVGLMLIPGLGEVAGAGKLARIAAGVGINVAAGELQQGAITQLQETTNYTDNMLPRIAGNAVVSGALGTFVSLLPKKEFEKLAETADTAINTPKVPTESTGGAAAVRGTTLEDETFNSAGKQIAALDAKLGPYLRSPTMRIMSQSPVVESRRLIQRISDIGDGVLNKNMRGVETSDNVEMNANRIVKSREMQILRAHDDAFAEHVTEAGDQALSKHDFGAAILEAMSNGDRHEIPQVVKVAKAVRPFFDADHEMLTKIAPDADYDMLTRTAESYAPRVWDNNKITADRTNFENTLFEHFQTFPKTIPVPEATVKVAPKALGEGTGQSFIDEFHAQHPEKASLGMTGKKVGGANVALSHDPAADVNRVHVDMIRADEPGKALPAMRRLIKLADQHGVTLQTDAVPVGTGRLSEADLVKLYEHFGFKVDHNAPGAVRTTMVREGLNDRVKTVKEARTTIEGREYASPEAQAAKAENIKKLDLEHEKILKAHEAAQPAETAKTAVGPPKPVVKDPAEIKADVQDTIDNIQHAVRGTADVGTGVRNPKSTKARALDITDNAARPWLSDDFEGTIKSYMRTMVPHIEMHRQFGSVTLEKEFQEISDAYRVKMAGAVSDEAKAKLVKQREQDISDLALQRDRQLGQAGTRNNESVGIVRASQIARTVNYIRSLGGQLFSALPDYGRVVAHYGLANTNARTAQFLMSSEARNLAMTDAGRMGTATDIVLHTREHSLEGAGEMVPTGDKFSKFLQNQSARFTKLSMIAHWDASIRLISAQLEQDSLYRLVTGAKMSTLERERLAAHGIGDEHIPAIKEQWETHGSNEMGLNRARTELWTDKDAAAKVENAVQRAGSSNAFFVGKGDMPAIADTQFGKFMFQFKGFVMGSVERLVLPLAQGLAHGDIKAANGLAMMLTLGGLSYYLKERAAGREPDMSPKNFGAEMVQRSGILAFAPDIYDPIAGLMHLPRFSKFKDHSWEETLGGPTLGEIDILGQVVSKITAGKMSAQDLHKMRQLLPYNTMFYLNRLFNLVEGKAADAMDLKNATHRPAEDYFNPAKDKEALPPQADNEHFLGIHAIPNSQL